MDFLLVSGWAIPKMTVDLLDEMDDILSVVSGIDSESEFGAIDYEEELSPPATAVLVQLLRIRSPKKKKARTCKIVLYKKESLSDGGIYQKVKRKLQRSKKKKNNNNSKRKQKDSAKSISNPPPER